MPRRTTATPRSTTPVQIVGAALAALMGLIAVFDVVRASTGAGHAAAAWTDAALSVVTGLLMLGALWLSRSGREQAAAWTLVTMTALRVVLTTTLVAPQGYPVIWPLYLLPIVIAQVLISAPAGLITAAGCVPMFVFTYASLTETPELTAGLPEAACGNVLLYLLVASVVYLAIQRMAEALRRSDQLVSSHERARTELREREEQFRALAESSATGIVIQQDGHLVYGNPHFAGMARCLGSDVFGLSLWDFFDKLGVEALQAQLTRRKTFGTDPVPPNQVLFKPLKGPGRWCEVAVAEALFWQKPAIVANLLDVTDRVEAQQEVRRERDFSHNIINAANAVIMVLNQDAQIVLLNQAGLTLTGYTEEEVRGRVYWEVVVPPKMREANVALFDSMRHGEASGEVEGPWLTHAGDEVTISWRYVAQYRADGQLSSVIAVGIDVTQQRNLERQASATEGLRSLGQIAGGVAHDLNNMLAGIMGPTDLLMMIEDDPEKERALKGIMAAATRGAETVRRIQSFSKARTDVDKQVFDLRELTEDVIFSLRPRWKDGAQRQGLTIRVHDEVPPGLMVHASAGEIGNVLMNLIVNACEAMKSDGEITVTGMLKEGQVQFHVADTGSGMPPETMEQIFHPFFSTKGAENSGLGLAVIHGIILRHGGTITVDSTVGKGTTFTITLPAQLPDPAERKVPAAEATSADELRLLVVDDVPEIADYLVAIARRMGHQAVSAYSGEDALKCLEAETFDVLITDYGMEGISGPELAERARELQPALRLILVTGWDVAIEDYPIFSGMLKKPCTRSQVEDLLAGLSTATPS